MNSRLDEVVRTANHLIQATSKNTFLHIMIRIAPSYETTKQHPTAISAPAGPRSAAGSADRQKWPDRSDPYHDRSRAERARADQDQVYGFQGGEARADR